MLNSNIITVNTRNRVFPSQISNYIKEQLALRLTCDKIHEVDIYLLSHEYQRYIREPSGNRLVIFFDASLKTDANSVLSDDTIIQINDHVFNGLNLLLPSNRGIWIRSDNDVIIAEFIPQNFELNILFNPFEDLTEPALTIGKDIFEFILTRLQRDYFNSLISLTSWKYTTEKEILKDKTLELLLQYKQKAINDDISKIKNWEYEINTYKQTIKEYFDKVIQKRRIVDTEQRAMKSIENTIIKELDLIAIHEKVADIHVKNTMFVITTVPLYIIDDNDNRYYMGKFTINIKPENADVKFYGDNPRQGYWSPQDPHPHISHDGVACLGTASATIAELCSQYELYALVLVCIDFIENVNTEDIAGVHIQSWDKVDENGNVIEYGHSISSESEEECDRCHVLIHEDNLATVFDNMVNDNGRWYPEDDRRVCQPCREEFYRWDDGSEEYINSDFSRPTEDDNEPNVDSSDQEVVSL